MEYVIEFAESTKEQIKYLSARQRALALDSIQTQLLHEPLKEARNRKPLRPNPLAPWELRVNNLRIFYEIAADQPNVVRILAVGQKIGNRLLIAGKEIKL